MPGFDKAPSTYIGHCFRRTAATWAADFGVSIINFKRFGRWKSDEFAMEYVDDSSKTKEEIAQSVSIPPSTNNPIIQLQEASNNSLPVLNFSGGFNNCTINISYEK